MSSTFSIALSALQAQSEAINTTGNNLANLNTTGFKGSAVSFKDLFGETLGANNSFQVGLGVGVPISDTVFSQGAIQNSNSSYAAAVQGNGFFVVNSPTKEQLFTRDGNFTLDASGTLKTQTGETVQGWTATASGINTTGAPGDIVLPNSPLLAPRSTQNLSISANLDAAAAVGSADASYQVPVQVTDSLGSQHALTFTFTKSAANTWNYNVTIPGGDLTGGTAGTEVSILSSPGTVTFDSSGNMTSSTSPVALSSGGLADGASPLSINWSMLSTGGSPLMTQYSEASTSTSKQDGFQGAQLSAIGIQNGGQVVATFSNGQQKVEAQLALASIQNPDSLNNVGNNNYVVTGKTATPSIGLPQTGARGQIDGAALEGSNVDLAAQFTNLIVYQSAYQAASKVVTTADQMTQTLLNIIH